MKFFSHLFALYLLSVGNLVIGQTNFRDGFEKAEPIENIDSFKLPEKVKIHQAFYEKALMEKDPLRQLYGQIYLSNDYLRAQDYAEATRFLLKAEAIAQVANKPGWLGWVMLKKGTISVKLKANEDALKIFEKAASLCGEARDSLCLGESLEQISIMHAMLDEFEKARAVNRVAMPLLKKFGSDKQMASALNNFGSINSLQNRPAEAIPYFEQSIKLYRQLGNLKSELKTLNNLADAYRKLKQYDRAVEIFQHCIRLNAQNQLPENLIKNYIGVGLTYRNKGDYENALRYLEEYEHLKDSLIGTETNLKIKELEKKYESQQKDLALERSKSKLDAAERALEKRTALILFILSLIAVGMWRWRLQITSAKENAARNQENLSNLTRILVEKNQHLLRLEEKIQSIENQPNNGEEAFDFDGGLNNQHILTEADWSSFKAYFEKAHPNYIQRLRNSFPALTDAEERLFLFIKLNLSTKEAASILGISAESVKKTRNRLRKRLKMDVDVSLEEFIRLF